MRKSIIILGCVIIAGALTYAGIVMFANFNQKPLGVRDRTNNNINVMLERLDNWEKIAGEAVISEEDMAIIDGSTATIPVTAELFRQFFDFADFEIYDNAVVYHSTTHDAYINLIDKSSRIWDERESRARAVSLIFVTPPSDEELDYAKSRGVELDLTPIAKDGFVFITHKDNPVDSLTIGQIQDIYSGKITNWKEVGGEDLEIRPYQREKNSGSQTAMENLVMQGKEMLPPETVLADIWFGMGALVEAVAEYENGPSSIGYSYYYYLNNLYKNENIKVIEINDITPSNENLISGLYPFSTNYLAVMRKEDNEDEDSPARKLRDYLVSPEGQKIIGMAGYCGAVS